MGRSSRHRDKHEKEGELFEDHRNGGTAARTRPLSFDEIMRRRKNKEKSGNVEDSPEGTAIIGEATPVKLSIREESNKHRDKDYGTSRGKRVSDESVKVTSRRKEDDSSIKEGKRMKDEEKGSYVIERKAKANLNTINSGDKIKGGKTSRLAYDKRKDELLIDDSGYDHGKRDSKVPIFKDRHADGSRETSEMVSKRKKENEEDKRTREQNAAKKHDSKKRHASEFSERNETKVEIHSRHDDSRSKKRQYRRREHDKEKSRSLSPEPAKKEKKEAQKSSYEDTKSKRRRSRSREHEKDKHRRSRSRSPKGHKRTSYDTREHVELASQSSKDKSGRSTSDVDKKRIPINGSSNQSRWHGESTSRLGGYSPRKRRSEIAIKTPSPTSRSPEKKNAGWDIPSAKAESNYLGSNMPKSESLNQTVRSREPELPNVVVTVPSSNSIPILGVVSTLPSSMIKSSIDSIQLTQATRPKRRLYIENLPSSASEEAVMKWINSYLHSSGVNHIQGTNPCISCIIHKEKGQALVEFLTPEDASAALTFDGKTFSGTILKIRRPKDFAEVTTGVAERSVAAVDSIRDIVDESPHKIFIGGISNFISSEMLLEIVSAFGLLKAYHFETNMDLMGSCAFLEYVDQSVTSKACAGLNGMRLGGQILTVTRAFPDASSLENLGNKPLYEIPDHAKPLLEKPTQVLKLNNVLDPSSLSSLSESELDEILEDIRLECARFGTVKSINIVKLTKCTTSSDACGDTINTDSALDNEDCNDKKKTEEGMDLDTANNGSLNKSSVVLANDKLEEVEKPGKESTEDDERADESHLIILKKESEELNKDVQANNTAHGVELVKDEIIDQEILQNTSANKQCTPVDDQLNNKENNVDDNGINTEDCVMGNKDLVEVELKPKDENDNEEKEADLDNVKKEDFSSGGDFQKEDGSDIIDTFEPGCVLVEYRRAEASSIAAHSLHGRLFDNRVVKVEYVSHDLYSARFPK